jgi:hypothetical protein
MNKDSSSSLPQQKAQKLKAILHLCTGCGTTNVKLPNPFDEEKKQGDVNMIDSSQIKPGFMPPYQE